MLTGSQPRQTTSTVPQPSSTSGSVSWQTSLAEDTGNTHLTLSVTLELPQEAVSLAGEPMALVSVSLARLLGTTGNWSSPLPSTLLGSTSLSPLKLIGMLAGLLLTSTTAGAVIWHYVGVILSAP